MSLHVVALNPKFQSIPPSGEKLILASNGRKHRKNDPLHFCEVAFASSCTPSKATSWNFTRAAMFFRSPVLRSSAFFTAR